MKVAHNICAQWICLHFANWLWKLVPEAASDVEYRISNFKAKILDFVQKPNWCRLTHIVRQWRKKRQKEWATCVKTVVAGSVQVIILLCVSSRLSVPIPRNEKRKEMSRAEWCDNWGWNRGKTKMWCDNESHRISRRLKFLYFRRITFAYFPQ